MSCRDGILSAAEAKGMIRDSQNEMIRRKNNLDSQKEKQEKALHEKLSQRKKQQMQELVKDSNPSHYNFFHLSYYVYIFSRRRANVKNRKEMS